MGHWRRNAQRIGAVASLGGAMAVAGCALLSGASDLTVGDVGDDAAATIDGAALDGGGMPDSAGMPGVDGGGGRFDAGGDANVSDGGDAGTRLRNATFEDGTLTGLHGGDVTFGTPLIVSGTTALAGADSLSVDNAPSGIEVDVPTLTEVYATALVRVESLGFLSDMALLSFVPESGGTIAELHWQQSITGGSFVVEVGGLPVGQGGSASVPNTVYRIGFHLRQDATSKLIEVFVAPAGMPFGAPFVTSTTALGRTIAIRMGALTAISAAVKITFDNLLIDTAAMPGP